MVQKAGKFGRLQVTRLQIYYGVTQAETTLFSFEELQSFDLPMTRFPFLLHHKGALIFQIKRPLFWKNARICPSLSATEILTFFFKTGVPAPSFPDSINSRNSASVLLSMAPFSIGRSSQVPAGVPRNREKLPLSTPKNESNLTRNWDFCEKMWHLSHPRTAILLYELADPQGSRSKGRIAVSG